MSISISNVSAYNTASYAAKNAKTAENAQAADAEKITDKAADSSADTEGTKDVTDVKNKNSDVDVDALIEQNNQRMESFKKTLMAMVTKQGEKSNATIFGMNLTVTQEDSQKAQAAISEGGEWSVNAVSDRIMNMAYALSGGDESKLATLKNAVMEGFKQAGFDPSNKSGCGMPEITGQTYDEIMKRFDDWEQNGMKTYDTNNAATAADAAAKSTISVLA